MPDQPGSSAREPQTETPDQPEMWRFIEDWLAPDTAEAHVEWMRRLLPVLTEAREQGRREGLAAAWQRCEAALPEGLAFQGVVATDNRAYRWSAVAAPINPKGRNRRGIYEIQYDYSPVKAIDALTDRLLARLAPQGRDTGEAGCG